MTKREALEKTEEIIKEWVSIRDYNDLVGLQKVRDRMSEHLVYLGQMESQYDSEASLAKAEIEQCIDEYKQSIWDAKTQGSKMSVNEIDTRARNHCREIITKHIHADINFKWYRRIISRCDQVLNSTASGQKVIMKALS